MNLNLPEWMINKIVHILSEKPYNEVAQIIQTIKSQVESDQYD